MTEPIRSPQHWRECAEEARTTAEGLTSEEARQHMLSCANPMIDWLSWPKRNCLRGSEAKYSASANTRSVILPTPA
jgi:hypothetical protein